MPSTYAHYSFGRRVLSALPAPVYEELRPHLRLFDIGCHGPDILFFYHPLWPNPVSEAGREMHSRSARDFFELARRHILTYTCPEETAAAAAYLAGFLCHFALDSACHGAVETAAAAGGPGHLQIEMEFDRYLMVRDGLDPLSFPLTAHIRPRPAFAAAISDLLPGVTADKVEAALRSMIRCHGLMHAPDGLKRAFLRRAAPHLPGLSELCGLLISETPSPACTGIRRELLGLYSAALPQACALILDFRRCCAQNQPLGPRYSRAYGPETPPQPASRTAPQPQPAAQI